MTVSVLLVAIDNQSIPCALPASPAKSTIGQGTAMSRPRSLGPRSPIMIFLDSVPVKVQLDSWPRRQRKAFELSFHPFNRDHFERPIPSPRASRAKGTRMRTLVQPPPSTHCDLCGGELRLKLVEPANRTMDLENEIFVCVSCGREISFVVNHDKYAAH
jgi:hypothetical protein